MPNLIDGPHTRSQIVRNRRVATSSLAAVVLGLSVGGTAHAQAADPERPPEDTSVADSAQTGDIIVTARRVEERLQDIPASVSAIGTTAAEKMNSLADIQSQVSGVTFQAVGPSPAIGIRGFGNRTQAQNPSQSAVGIFVDGVFVSPALAIDINRTDVQRIEIAKGPQSTLYGRSSFTGAINIVTADPTPDFSGFVEAGYGMSSVHGENLYKLRGAISVPLGDTLSVRFFGAREKRDGFAYDSVTGNRAGGYNRKIGRVRLLWEPSNVVTGRLTGTIIRDDLPFPLVNAGRIRAPLGQRLVLGNFTRPDVNAALQFGKDVWDATYVNPQHSRVRGEQATLDLRFDTPMGELASLTDYQHASLATTLSLDLTRLAFATGNGTNDDKRYSQELRLSNDTGRFSYLLGLYYLHSVLNQAGGRSIDFGAGTALGSGAILFDRPPGIPLPPASNASVSPAYTKTDAYAAFGQLGYDISDDLNLTVGLRQGRDELEGVTGSFLRARAGFTVTSTPFTYRKAAFNATTGSANLSYKVAPDVTVYGSFARGNSPGGLNVGGSALVNFAPQSVDAYELGLRSQFLDRRVRLNVALFENRYDDLQLSQNLFIAGNLTPTTTNAAKARGRGVDIDTGVIVSDSLSFNVQYTYVDSKITDYTIPPPPTPQVNLTGVPLVRSPKHSLNASATFRHDLGPGVFQLTAEESYTSSYTNDYLGVPPGFAFPGIPGVRPAGVTTTQVLELYRTKGYALTNLNASYTVNNWEFGASVRNLFNKQYIGSVLAFDLITVPLELPGLPRTVEASVKYRF